MAKPYNVLVEVHGDFPVALKRFSKLAKNELASSVFRHTSSLYVFTPRSPRLKRKSLKVRQRLRSAARRAPRRRPRMPDGML